MGARLEFCTRNSRLSRDGALWGEWKKSAFNVGSMMPYHVAKIQRLCHMYVSGLFLRPWSSCGIDHSRTHFSELEARYMQGLVDSVCLQHNATIHLEVVTRLSLEDFFFLSGPLLPEEVAKTNLAPTMHLHLKRCLLLRHGSENFKTGLLRQWRCPWKRGLGHSFDLETGRIVYYPERSGIAGEQRTMNSPQ